MPILIDEGQPNAVGVLSVLHAIEGPLTARLPWPACFPPIPRIRPEMWRLCEWVLLKLNDEVTRYVVEEKILKRYWPGATPDPSVLRVAKANLIEHMLYFNWLFATRQWLAGDAMTLADFALAAHCSSLDYLGEAPWRRRWKCAKRGRRIKSRPAFRTLLNDRMGGMPPARRLRRP